MFWVFVSIAALVLFPSLLIPLFMISTPLIVVLSILLPLVLVLAFATWVYDYYNSKKPSDKHDKQWLADQIDEANRQWRADRIKKYGQSRYADRLIPSYKPPLR